MTNLTLSVPDDLYEEMKKHPEIRWSEVARQALAKKLDDLRRLDALLSRLRAQGMSVLLVEHNLRLVRSVADRVIVMAAGAVIATGTPADVAGDADVRAAYLGRAALTAEFRRVIEGVVLHEHQIATIHMKPDAGGC